MNSAGALPTRAFDLTAIKVFAWLWAAGMVSHMASYSEPLRPVTAAMFTLALVVLFRPSMTIAFLALVAVHLFYVYELLPEVPNHSLIAAFIDLTILTTAIWQSARKRAWSIEPGELYRAFAPVVRIELLLVYFFVVFHKLNSGFFDPQHSCGAVMYMRLAHEYPIMPTGDWMRFGAIYLTVLIEAIIPVMLVARGLRLAGLVLAFGFHFSLAMDPGDVVFNFSAILIAIFFLFLPDDFPAAVSATLEPVRGAWRTVRIPKVMRLAAQGLIFLCVAAVLAALIFRRALPTGLTQETARGIWVLYSAFIFATFLATVWRHRLRFESARELLMVRSPGLLIVPALLFVNGLTPYLGGKTEISFAMYSNLRTEGGQTNHWLMPSWLQIWDYQRDLVKVQRTSAGRLRRWANRGYQLPYYEFREWIREYPRASITYERNGVTTSVRRVNTNPELMRPENPLRRKLLKFRPVPLDPTQSPCIH